MRTAKNGAIVLCEAPMPGMDGWKVILCDWDGESVSWLEDPNGHTIQGCYRGDAIPGFVKRAELDSFNGWFQGRVK